MDELNGLPYLDAVVRENLRLNSALDATFRCAGQDTFIPVSTPYIDKSGVERREVRYAIFLDPPKPLLTDMCTL